MSARFRPIRGFTLIELLVSLAVMALLALLSWRGLDGMTRAQVNMRERMDEVLTLQIGLTQWSADLDAVMETAQVSGIDYDGRVLRLTRRDTSSEGSPLRVVGWARRVIEDPENGRGSWARWQSPPPTHPGRTAGRLGAGSVLGAKPGRCAEAARGRGRRSGSMADFFLSQQRLEQSAVRGQRHGGEHGPSRRRLDTLCASGRRRPCALA